MLSNLGTERKRFAVLQLFYYYLGSRNFVSQSLKENKSLTPKKIQLRPYQEECINESLKQFENGITRQAVSLPVGSGKTVILANLLHRIPKRSNGGDKVLVLAHRTELLYQAKKQINNFFPNLRVAIEKGSLHCNVDNEDVIIASVPTLGRTGDRINKFNPDQFKCVIIDEAHHSAADTYIRIMKHFKINSENSEKIAHEIGILLWGCSATMSRNDDKALKNVFDKVVYHLDISNLISNGWLCAPKIKRIYTKIDLKKVKYQRGDFEVRDLSLAIDTPKRNSLVAATWWSIAKQSEGRKSTIVFALTIKHVINLCKEFSDLDPNISVKMITSETGAEIRSEILNQFSLGNVDILINCAVLTEGTDLPRTDCIVLTRPTCNSNLYTQMVGRGLRKHEAKKDCLVLDFVDDISPNRSLGTIPSLESSFPPKKEAHSQESEIEKVIKSHKKKRLANDIEPGNFQLRILDVENVHNPLPLPNLNWLKLSKTEFCICSNHIDLLLRFTSPSLGQLYEVCKNKIIKTLTKEPSQMILIADIITIYLRNHSQLGSGSFKRVKIPMTRLQRICINNYMRNNIRPPVTKQESKYINSLNRGTIADFNAKIRFWRYILKEPIKTFRDLVDSP